MSHPVTLTSRTSFFSKMSFELDQKCRQQFHLNTTCAFSPYFVLPFLQPGDNFGEDKDVICNDRDACQREYESQTVQYIPLLRSRDCCLRPLRQQGIVPS